MSGFEDSDHYDALEVSRDASADEIERAYRLLKATYADDSLAVYSMFGEEDSASLRDRIDAAYRVLSDPALRSSYDAALAAGEPLEDEPAADEMVVLAPLAEAALAKPLVETRPREMPALDRIADADEDEADAESEWTGARLRRARLLRGMEIDDVATATKITPAYLRFLEEERFDDLPAVVYVRGFIASYARCLGLDAQGAARSYSARYEAHRRSKPKSRLLGRR
jgi:flagellar biosynthesis protein FlhG